MPFVRKRDLTKKHLIDNASDTLSTSVYSQEEHREPSPFNYQSCMEGLQVLEEHIHELNL
jgi:hypothetical protein